MLCNFSCTEWYWECVVRCYLLRGMAVFCALVSVAVVWSELTFFVKDPPLTLFANFVRLAQKNNDYFTIEVSPIHFNRANAFSW